jgi:hypothetical protein
MTVFVLVATYTVHVPNDLILKTEKYIFSDNIYI